MATQQAQHPARILAEILVFFAVVVADAFGLVPLTQTLLLVPLIWLTLRLQRQPWSIIGWSRPRSWTGVLLTGLAAGLAMELFAVHVSTPWISAAFGTEPDYSGLKSIQGNLPALALFLVLSWSFAAFGEEICFRGFLMQRLASLLGDHRGSWVASLVLSSLLFGWGHTEQGLAGWVQEGLSGLLLGALFLCCGRKLAVPVVAHGVSNTLAFTLIYLGRYPGLG